MATAATYEERKAITADTGSCVEPGCDDPAASGSLKCFGHRERAREANREYRKRLRKRRRRRRECIDCGNKLRSSERIYCTRHRIARNRQPAGVRAGVDKFERIAQRTVRGEDGRTRYHGQERRGQQTHEQLDDQDLAFARREIDRGELGLDAYRAEVAKAKAGDPETMPRIRREGLRSDAIGYFERAQRHLDDVIDRHSGGHALRRHGKREGEE